VLRVRIDGLAIMAGAHRRFVRRTVPAIGENVQIVRSRVEDCVIMEATQIRTSPAR
jgi:hypothetical protein